MFEKNEDYRKARKESKDKITKVIKVWSAREETIHDEGFKNGAEFGYNKAKEDADKMKSRFLELCNLKDMRIAELEKANEWHYVKDGDFPKVNELVLIKITGCFVLGWTNGTNWFNDSNNGTIIDRRMVIAWKEIVLPKESE